VSQYCYRDELGRVIINRGDPGTRPVYKMT
jgi:hypothetical protein